MSDIRCPKCESTNIGQYRCMTGPIWCNYCNFRVEQKEVYNPFVYEDEKLKFKEITPEQKESFMLLFGVLNDELKGRFSGLKIGSMLGLDAFQVGELVGKYWEEHPLQEIKPVACAGCAFLKKVIYPFKDKETGEWVDREFRKCNNYNEYLFLPDHEFEYDSRDYRDSIKSMPEECMGFKKRGIS